jgi:nitrous oxide reductase accessory protein NosL
MNKFNIASFVAVLVLTASIALAAAPQPAKPGPRDKCAVCGMFVAKYPDFAAQIQLKNGTVLHFDGPKDLFSWYLNPGQYRSRFTPKDVTAIYVTDYYSLTPVDAFTASYVIGSDVFGPMGKELIPFAKAKDAQGFLKDHRGTSILTFRQINQGVLKGVQ